MTAARSVSENPSAGAVFCDGDVSLCRVADVELAEIEIVDDWGGETEDVCADVDGALAEAEWSEAGDRRAGDLAGGSEVHRHGAGASAAPCWY